jgi:hypothetical protein
MLLALRPISSYQFPGHTGSHQVGSLPTSTKCQVVWVIKPDELSILLLAYWNLTNHRVHHEASFVEHMLNTTTHPCGRIAKRGEEAVPLSSIFFFFFIIIIIIIIFFFHLCCVQFTHTACYVVQIHSMYVPQGYDILQTRTASAFSRIRSRTAVTCNKQQWLLTIAILHIVQSRVIGSNKHDKSDCGCLPLVNE